MGFAGQMFSAFFTGPFALVVGAAVGLAVGLIIGRWLGSYG